MSSLTRSRGGLVTHSDIVVYFFDITMFHRIVRQLEFDQSWHEGGSNKGLKPTMANWG